MISLSRHLAGKGVRATGLQSFRHVTADCSGSEIIVEVLKHAGTHDEDRERLKMSHLRSLRTQPTTSSGPTAFLGLMFNRQSDFVTAQDRCCIVGGKGLHHLVFILPVKPSIEVAQFLSLLGTAVRG